MIKFAVFNARTKTPTLSECLAKIDALPSNQQDIYRQILAFDLITIAGFWPGDSASSGWPEMNAGILAQITQDMEQLRAAKPQMKLSEVLASLVSKYADSPEELREVLLNRITNSYRAAQAVCEQA